MIIYTAADNEAETVPEIANVLSKISLGMKIAPTAKKVPVESAAHPNPQDATNDFKNPGALAGKSLRERNVFPKSVSPLGKPLTVP